MKKSQLFLSGIGILAMLFVGCLNEEVTREEDVRDIEKVVQEDVEKGSDSVQNVTDNIGDLCEETSENEKKGLEIEIIASDMIQTSEQRIKEIFGIDREVYPYEVLTVEDTLKSEEYEGLYKAEILVEEVYMNKLCEMIEQEYACNCSGVDELGDGADSSLKILLSIHWGADIPFQKAGYDHGFARTISNPKPYLKKHLPHSMIICSLPDNGKCKVLLQYVE